MYAFYQEKICKDVNVTHLNEPGKDLNGFPLPGPLPNIVRGGPGMSESLDRVKPFRRVRRLAEAITIAESLADVETIKEWARLLSQQP